MWRWRRNWLNSPLWFKSRRCGRIAYRQLLPRGTDIVPDKLVHLGSGPHAQHGWDNLDKSPSLTLSRMKPVRKALLATGFIGPTHNVDWSSDIRKADLRRRLPYRDGEVAAIYSSHTLEHLYLSDAIKLLDECHRVLVLGGLIRLALPDFAAIAEAFKRHELSGEALHHALNAHPFTRPTGRGRLQRMLSASIHRWQPTTDLVQQLLANSGFGDIRIESFRNGKIPDLETIETRYESLFVEATKVSGS
jgi:predicted SAM-dependent methyltransferase